METIEEKGPTTEMQKSHDAPAVKNFDLKKVIMVNRN